MIICMYLLCCYLAILLRALCRDGTALLACLRLGGLQKYQIPQMYRHICMLAMRP